MRPENWVSIFGRFEREPDSVIYTGASATPHVGGALPGKQDTPAASGLFVSDLLFGGGEITAGVTFEGDVDSSAAGLVLYHQPGTNGILEAQIGGYGSFASLFAFYNQQWTPLAYTADPRQLQAGREYRVSVAAEGSRVAVTVDGVHLIDANLPFTLPRGQAGVWATGPARIAFRNFDVEPKRPDMFVVMQFTEEFDELYREVIRPVGEELGYAVIRADDMAGPGLIITDIERQIREAQVVVADITPVNANVYWEVGFSRALQKPTILMAERATDLPFDVSGFRTLFYDNTIAGKGRIEAGLRRHLEAIATEGAGVTGRA